MKLENILLDLKRDNINFLYQKLKSSKDKKSINLLNLLYSGKDMYESLLLIFPSFMARFLSVKEPEILLNFGKFLVIQKEVNNKVFGSVFYSVFLSFFSIFSVLLIRTFLEVQFYEIIVLQLCLVLIVLRSLILIKKKHLDFLRFKMLFLFISGSINYYSLCKIMSLFDVDLDYMENNIEKINQKVFLGFPGHMAENFLNLDLAKLFLSKAASDLSEYCDNIYKQNILSSLFCVGLYIFVFVTKAIRIMVSKN